MNELEKLLGYEFKDKGLLDKAFTHSTYSQLHGGENNEIFEFLGDSIIGFVIAEELIRRYPKLDEGKLTKMRGAIVSRQPLSQVVEQRGYDKFIKLGFGEVQTKMRSSIFEAVTCAIYLDGGMDRAKAFVLDNLAELIENSAENSHKDFKSELFEKYGNENVEFKCKDKSGPQHDPVYTIELYVEKKLVATAQDRNMRNAQQKCAETFLESAKK